ncbi:Uncharacterised protein [Klebsiella pneumoniae]|nr:Uncharacterised protein [Klebsiella pneumoniae]STW67805.1 Uncharacterised protein [Klebsiella pneumoniae]
MLIVYLTLRGIGTAGGDFDERQIDKHRDDDADKLGHHRPIEPAVESQALISGGVVQGTITTALPAKPVRVAK